MSYYEVLLFLHIGAAAIWLGSAFLFFVLFQRAKRSDDPLLAQRLGAHTEWLAKRLFIPASIKSDADTHPREEAMPGGGRIA